MSSLVRLNRLRHWIDPLLSICALLISRLDSVSTTGVGLSSFFAYHQARMRYQYFIKSIVILGIVGPGLMAQNYTIVDQPWPESLGNHRALLELDQAAEAVAVDLVWRRHDQNPEQRRFIIIHEESGDTIPNIHRFHLDNERCQLIVGPVLKTGKYHFYYLPYEVQKEYGFYSRDYLDPEDPADPSWVKQNDLSQRDAWSRLPKAKLVSLQARTAFDSFYPMEVIALKSEKDVLLRDHQEDFLVFPEDRKYPIRMLDDVPQRWIEKGPSNVFKGGALRNEYYVFQLGLYASTQDLEHVQVEFFPLQSDETSLSADRITCFNTGGIGPYGDTFAIELKVAKGGVQPLWIGVDIPEETAAGIYRGEVIISADGVESQTIAINLEVASEILTDRGDGEKWRHSRLRWLNSSLGLDHRPTQPFEPILDLGENTFGLTDKRMTLAENGFPGSLKVGSAEILEDAMTLEIMTEDGNLECSHPYNIKRLKDEPGILTGTWESTSEHLHLSGFGSLEADGHMNYQVKLQAKKRVALKDVALHIPFRKEIAQYMMGMGLPGGLVPESHESKWKGPHDSFWVGNTEAGLWCELRGGSYHGPLLNLYRPDHPHSWNNEGKGGFKIERTSGQVHAIAYSGARDLNEGQEITFEWSILLTPVKQIDLKSQFLDRYYHNGGDPVPRDSDLTSGVKIVNLHHANNYNPHINYPFVAVDSMRWFVEWMHQKGLKVKIYYTIRELTNYTTELWALRSLGNEILGGGKGGGYPWLQEHLVTNYRPQWYQWFPDQSADASIVNAPGESRWYNYYIEGLAWLVKHVDIDGLYLDDVSYDRRTVKRIRKVMDDLKPGCLLDLHSNTGFSKGPATQYAEFFPFMDKLWFGESFQYDHMPPENWLVEVSGIPFGLMGDMLHGGGNRWLGMLFGMTVRHPWLTEGVVCDPRPVWEIWDSFGIHDSKMIGFWEDTPLVRSSNSEVKATAYVKEHQILIALGSWASEKTSTTLTLDWDLLGVSRPDHTQWVAPKIQDFQVQQTFPLNDPIEIEPKKGWLLLLDY